MKWTLTLRHRWCALLAQIDSRNQRERIMLLCVTLALLYALFQVAAYNPLRKYHTQLQARITANQANLTAVQTKMQELRAHIGKDPNMPYRAHLDELTRRLDGADAPLTEIMKSLVTPQEMTALVNSVLSRHRELKTVRVENLPFEELRDPSPPAEQPDKKAGPTPQSNPTPETEPLYKHGLRIEVHGGFREIVAFIRELEQMHWRVLWDTVDIKTERHPASSAEITVYTLSRDNTWISL